MIEDEADHVVVQSDECRHFVGHGITGTMGMPVSVAVRPEKIAISFDQQQDPADAKYNSVEGTLVDWAYLGSYTVYYLQLQSGLMLKATSANTERSAGHLPKAGETVRARWSPDNIVVLTQ